MQRLLTKALSDDDTACEIARELIRKARAGRPHYNVMEAARVIDFAESIERERGCVPPWFGEDF